jgi:hypothetical protein
MKKWIIIGGAALIVIIAVVVVIGLSKLGPMIKHAVNTFAPEITKTEVRLGDVDVSVFSGKATIKEFYLGNPKGFQSPQAMKVGSIYVDVDEKSLTGDTIIIDTIEILNPDITYEKAKGSDNFRTILDNVTKSVGAGKPKRKQEKAEDEGKKILIRNVIVKGGNVNLSMALLSGGSIQAPLPDIHLKDIGKKSGGASPAEAFKEVFASIYGGIKSPDVTATFDRGLKDLGVGVQKIGEDTKKEVEGIADKVKGLFGN